MLLLLAALSAVAATPPPAKVGTSARVSITIVRGHRASSENWDPRVRANQREVVKEERDGSRNRLRLTEFE